MLEPLRKQIQRAMQNGEVPGLAIAILEQGEIAEIAGFGVMRHGEASPVTTDTIFPIASITKPVSTYAVLKLVEQGILDLDQPLDSYLPEPYLPSEPNAASISARHVLSHQSGLPNWRPKKRRLRMNWEPGVHFNYSGEGYEYLQRVAERITGKRMVHYVQEHVFGPLGMQNSSLNGRRADAEQMAWGYGDGKHWVPRKKKLPSFAHTMYSSVRDLAYFMKAILSTKVDNNDSDFLSQASLEQIFTPQIRVGEWPKLFWGLGWGIQRTEKSELMWHWGAKAGYRHYIAASRKYQCGIVILTNFEEGLYAIKEILSLLDNPILSVSHPAFDWLLPTDAWREDGRIIAQTVAP